MYVIGVLTKDHKYAIVANTKIKLSKKQLKRTLKRFKRDNDYAGFFQHPFDKFYDTKRHCQLDSIEIDFKV